MFKYLLLFAIYTFCVTPVFEAGERVKGSELRCKYRFTITDLNNDGLQDIVVLSGGGDRAYIHYNEGSIGKPSFSFSQRLFINFSELEPNLVTLSYSIQAFDWDKDGDPDFILSDGNGYNYGGVYLATNIGSASNYLLRPGHKLANSTTTTYCRAADLDRDGLNDILYNDKGRILWRRNLVANDSATKVDSAVVLRCTGIDSISSVTGSRFETADLNGDSLVDIITFGGTGNVVRFYAGSTDPDSFSTPVTIFSFPKGVDLSICDWNNNGINDILVLDSSIGALLYFQNKGTASAPVFSTLADDTIRGSELSQIEEFMNFQLLDWNKDNRMDIVIGGGFDVHCSGSNPALKLYLNQSSEGIPKFENGHIIRPLTNSNGGGYWNGGRFPAIADYNNDGYLDMFATWNYSTSGQKNINYFTGNNSTQSSYFFAKESVSVFPLYGSAEFFASPVVVDWNKDGLTDLLISTRNDADNTVKIFYYPNLGTATLPRICDSAKKLVISIPGTIASGCCYPAVADLDKDGKQDLLVGFRNNVLFYSNQGTDDAPVFVNGTTLMLKSLIDSVCLPSTFPGFILSHNMIRKGAKMTYPGVTDWDGDGTLDLIVAFYYFTGAWALSTSELWLFRGVNNSTDCEFSSKKSSNKLSVYPNPFNPTTLISLQSGFKGNGVLKIFNMQGQQVYTCSKPGLKHVWNAKGSAAGVYNVRYTEQGKSRNLRILLTR